MKKYLLFPRFILFFPLFMLLLAAAPAGAVEELHIMAVPDYHPPSIVARFEKEYGIRLRFEYVASSEEMMARMNAGYRGDLVMPRGYSVNGLVHNRQLAKLDRQLLPNLKNLAPQFLENPADPGCNYHIPYLVANMGILYRQDRIKNFIPSWGYLLNPANRAAPFALLDAYRETTGMALLYLGYSYNSRTPVEIEEAMAVLEKTAVRPTFMGFMTRAGARRFLQEGFVDAIVTFNGDAAVLSAADPRLNYVTPQEGSILRTDAYVINALSTRKEAAHKWLNFIMDPQVAAEITEWTRHTTPNAKAIPFISPAIRQNQIIYPGDQVWSNTQVPRSLGSATRVYIDYWSRLKNM